MLKFMALLLLLAGQGQASPTRFRAPDNHVASVVEVTETCVDKQQEILIHFENSKQPIFDDWVGVYPNDYDPSDEPQQWVRAG